ncbi:MAG TPA: hypothetical protein VF042_06555, partial [Gemmatimonadaceae bacterium]
MRVRSVAAIGLLAACTSSSDALLAPQPLTDPSYEIYAVVLDSLFLARGRGDTPQFIVIDSAHSGGLNKADFEYAARELNKNHPAAFQAVQAQFASAPVVRKRLDATRFHTGARVTLVSRNDVSSKQLGAKYWEGFYARFPGARGIITLGTPA